MRHFAPIPPMPALTRRALLRHASMLAAVALSAPLLARPILGQPRLLDYPFKLGVASGDPLSDGFVIWTRLAPDPLNGGGMPAEAIEVRYEVANEPRFLEVIRRGISVALPEHGHAVHVEVDGLEPDRWYWYRFIAAGEASPIGRTRTFPIIGAAKDRLRFAFASCQHYGQGFFNAYDAMLEGSRCRPRDRPRSRETDTPHGRPAGSEQDDPVESFLQRRAAAYQAYYEHMPLRRTARPVGPEMRLYTSSSFGDLAHFMTLDNRQYRSDQACQAPPKFGGQVIPAGCAERLADDRTMLGVDQERWVARELNGADAAWKVVAQQMLMAQLEQKAGEGEAWWSDGWDGYPAGRKRLLDHIAQRDIKDVVVLGGDIHSFWVTDLKADFGDPASATVATEFVGTSVTSEGGPYDTFAKLMPENPHIRFFESRERGYVRAEVTQEQLRTDLRALRTIAEPDATVRTLGSWVVERGKAGAQPA